MEGPDDLGRYLSILFRADLSDVLGERRYGLYLRRRARTGRPPTVVVPSGADDRYVLAIPLPPGMDDAAIAAAFPLDRLHRRRSARPPDARTSRSSSWRRARSRSRPRSRRAGARAGSSSSAMPPTG